MIEYKEPELTVVCLDFCKPFESRILLESIRRHIKFPHKVAFVDNGSNESYSYEFLKEGLVDQLIINRESLGLGIGTRDGINAVFGKYFLSAQNDQYLGRDFTQEEFNQIKDILNSERGIMSVSLAGANCGQNCYSERGYIMKTEFYKWMEAKIPLGYHGAGKWHMGIWREETIQKFYKEHGLIHLTDYPQMVVDNGVFAVRDMGDCGVYCHRTDLKRLFVIVPPKTRNPAYPKVTEQEFALILRGEWPDGKIPEQELAHSFDCWSNTELGRREKEYIDNLRERFKNKGK